MAECDDGDKAGLVSVFARAPQQCAGTVAGLASALWLNAVGACAGLVAAWGALTLVNGIAVVLVGVLAMLVTAAGSLMAADWRAEVASRQAWAEIGIELAELCQPEPSAIDPCYLVTTDNHGLQSVFRAHRLAPPSAAPGTRAHLPAAASATGIVAEASKPLSTAAGWAGLPTVDDDAMAFQRRGRAGMALVQAPSAAVSCRVRLGIAHEHTASAVRLVANGGIWSDGFVGGERVLPPHAERAETVVLSGAQGRRDQSGFPDASTRDSAVDSDELPSCRGPPTADIRWAHATRTVPDGRTADPVVRDNLGDQVPVCAAELHVIETYLDQVLHDILAPGASAQDGETS
jgi:hypothetical protein